MSVLASRQERIPILLVATAHAHRLAWKNGLRLSDLLQGLVQTTPTTNASPVTSGPTANHNTTPFRSVSRLLHIPTEQWQMLQFLEEDSLDRMSDADAAAALQDATRLHDADGNLPQELALLEDQVDNLLSEDPVRDDGAYHGDTDHVDDDEHLQHVVADAHRLTSSLTIPWLRRYRQAADAATDRAAHEHFHCPALMLLVATSAEDDVIRTLRALQSNVHYWPKPYRDGRWDPTTIRRDVLVLHDTVEYAASHTEEWDETALRTQLKMCFGATAAVVRCNSLAPATAAQLAEEETRDVWGGGGRLGNCWTVGDRARLRQYIGGSLVTQAVIPALERRMADLNALVSERKKGVRNVLKSLWGGTTRSKRDEEEMATNAAASTSPGNGGDGHHEVKYRYDSIESQTRLLADTLFLIRDYDAALSMYRLIKDDFKQDKNWIHYGSVQEMMALCMYMLDPYGRAKEIFSCIENALLSYSRAADEPAPGRTATASLATRLATRLCLVLIAARNICSGRHLEVADLLASASSQETALGAAVLLEQSAAHYYQAEMYRKYAFHMLMSGHMFRTSEQEHHAFRCFTSALYIYRDGKWDELHNHVRSAVAAQLFSMGRMSVALQLYAKLLGTTGGGRVSVKSQQKFVQNVLEICSDHRKKALSGADRMLAPPHLSGAERDAVRSERLDRIVQVIRYTRSASRVLELPNMNLPYIDDASVVVIAEEAAHYRQERVLSFGDALIGAPDMWDELTFTMNAELKALSNESIHFKKTMSKIEDLDLRRVVAFLEEEKTNRSKLERTKKSGLSAESAPAPVRAIREPIAVEFTLRNPLGIPIDYCDMQLVARMTEESGNRVCTNEDAVSIRPLVSANEKPKWTFQSSSVEFDIADFCRVSTGRTDDVDREGWKSAEDVEPFFVVTKVNASIPPETKKVISANICPLVRGTLEVLGVRCRLFDAVWVYHPFDIKGPLLQNTRANRANRVRAESFLLKSRVERGMPCLAVELRRPETFASQDDGPALKDQVGDWILRIANVGTSAGSNLTLKTNLPWMYIANNNETAEAQQDAEKMPISTNIGPTGTLMTIPMHGSGLQVNGQIQPGESFDVPVKIRTSGVGKCDFYMLFRYELCGDAKFETSRFRWLKKMFSVPVYPSLEVTALVSPAFDASKDHILSVELANSRTDRPDLLDIYPSKLTIASHHYDLKPIAGPIALDSSIVLRWQERAAVHFRLKPKAVEGKNLLLTECSLSSESNTDENELPLAILNFLALERAHEAFEEAVGIHQMAIARAAAQSDEKNQVRSIASIRRANTVDSISDRNEVMIHDSHPTSIERLCLSTETANTIHVVCSWTAHDGTIRGLHHIRGLVVRPLNDTKSVGCPITVTATHPSVFSNDFNVGPAMIPFKVTLRNKLVESTVEFEFAMDHSDTFDFTGPERYCTALKGGEELSIPFRALIPVPGVYNLQKVRLVVSNGEPIPVSYVFPLQWLVTVHAI
jgi:ER-Golgi trafficking TRAPP I complex 85 kDa subunit